MVITPKLQLKMNKFYSKIKNSLKIGLATGLTMLSLYGCKQASEVKSGSDNLSDFVEHGFVEHRIGIVSDRADAYNYNYDRSTVPAIGDIDGDGDNDIVIIDQGNVMYWYENKLNEAKK